MKGNDEGCANGKDAGGGRGKWRDKKNKKKKKEEGEKRDGHQWS